MTVADAYAEVERLTRREARNFAYGIRVLPREKRQALSAVYAFARRVDDVADGELPVEEKREKLHELGIALDASPATAVFVALADARFRFAIPDKPLHDLVAGG
ncbi:MAG TPA: squalene/phytoene synthase family protein, partial [Gaiellaceae bacterium]|nr:squalene/phytoene synthase family protein [Gaiellaceae bacterium]